MPNEEKAEVALREATEPEPFSGKATSEKETVPATTMKARWNPATVQVYERHT